jgi:hypothetical protein
MKPTKIEKPVPDPAPVYDGPKVCDDTEREGCQHNAV